MSHSSKKVGLVYADVYTQFDALNRSNFMVIVNNNVKYSVWGGKKTVCTVHAPDLLLKKMQNKSKCSPYKTQIE